LAPTLRCEGWAIWRAWWWRASIGSRRWRDRLWTSTSRRTGWTRSERSSRGAGSARRAGPTMERYGATPGPTTSRPCGRKSPAEPEPLPLRRSEARVVAPRAPAPTRDATLRSWSDRRTAHR